LILRVAIPKFRAIRAARKMNAISKSGS
jgi:hypothetical protein